LKVTYLVNYEMAMDHRFQKFGKQILRDGTGEIGLHIHPWNSPPFQSMDEGGNAHHHYIYDFPPEIMHSKLDHLTGILSDVFEIQPVSHRAGKWGFDAETARILIDLGYLVDCSVTPGVSWKKYKGAPNGNGGPIYYDFPLSPYFLDPKNIQLEGASPLLEVPVTIRPRYHSAFRKTYERIRDRFAGKLFRAVFGLPYSWVRPTGENLSEILETVDWAIEQELPVIEFMIHSSELMPGGSPYFQTSEQIEILYRDLAELFAAVNKLDLRGFTLADYRSSYEITAGS
jgi:hypothetical protein